MVPIGLGLPSIPRNRGPGSHQAIGNAAIASEMPILTSRLASAPRTSVRGANTPPAMTPTAAITR